MNNEIDILEDDIREKYPQVLENLLRDHTTKKNIFWATDNYSHLGEGYEFASPILPELITGNNGHIIMPRVKKDFELQQSRIRGMAEVFTPAWICNAQNNLIDNAWFERENVFNFEILNPDGTNSWRINTEKITYPEGKSWKHYVRDTRLEISCGEAPYLTSRYDTTTGDFIPVENRIGLLDRKLRVINENLENTGEWLKETQKAYMNIFAYEWQGDSLLLARESMLFTFIENYIHKFNKQPLLTSINYIAYIIAWNLWQMDGLKFVVPESCQENESSQLFGDVIKSPCDGCKNENIYNHNGIYCVIKDWNKRNIDKDKKENEIKFIELLK